MKRNFALLTSPAFLVALALLLANDFIFKPLFHNQLTGKLSDFAGLFAFALFWMAFFPPRKTVVNLLIAGAFVFWKSAFSQNFIEAWNALPLFDVSRVVDYTDLLALITLPCAQIYARQVRPLCASFRFAPQAFALVALFAFAATSPAPDPHRRSAYFSEPYRFQVSRSELLQRFQRDVRGTANTSNTTRRELAHESPSPGKSDIPEAISEEEANTYTYILDAQVCGATTAVSFRFALFERDGNKTMLLLRNAEWRCQNEDNKNTENTNDDAMIQSIFEREVIDKLGAR